MSDTEIYANSYENDRPEAAPPSVYHTLKRFVRSKSSGNPSGQIRARV